MNTEYSVRHQWEVLIILWSGVAGYLSELFRRSAATCPTRCERILCRIIVVLELVRSRSCRGFWRFYVLCFGAFAVVTEHYFFFFLTEILLLWMDCFLNRFAFTGGKKIMLIIEIQKYIVIGEVVCWWVMRWSEWVLSAAHGPCSYSRVITCVPGREAARVVAYTLKIAHYHGLDGLGVSQAERVLTRQLEW